LKATTVVPLLIRQMPGAMATEVIGRGASNSRAGVARTDAGAARWAAGALIV
jgi:hypothetical protein